MAINSSVKPKAIFIPQEQVFSIINAKQDTVSRQIQYVTNKHITRQIQTLEQTLQHKPTNQEIDQYLQQNNEKIRNNINLYFEKYIYKFLKENIGSEKTNILFTHANKNTCIKKKPHMIYGLYRLTLTNSTLETISAMDNQNFTKLVKTIEFYSHTKSDFTEQDVHNIKRKIFQYQVDHASTLIKCKNKFHDITGIDVSDLLGSLKKKMNFGQHDDIHTDFHFLNIINTPCDAAKTLFFVCVFSGLPTVAAVIFPLLCVGKLGYTFAKYTKEDPQQASIHNSANIKQTSYNHVDRLTNKERQNTGSRYI
ncbi:hypothetical protein [Candidatus Neoehrlichia procyonis]|uniref:Uncharacterized protein n=1 Tax=Candidatus Neoehrlichia procyonis str. RAC413 TaxID=1359163 RepID=A0A0F3NLW2_9RICK|nr:hypothetical protein [Candidatus Neoehrlichia lotoris]KJV68682.1 hypothetical protein NLO413_0043 [Candidatus Neoehrlichia lotoris str. RAC413]